MENKILLLIFTGVILLGLADVSAQSKNDRITANVHSNLGMNRLRLNGQVNTGSEEKPFYEVKRITSLLFNANAIIGIHVPVFQNDKISVGVESGIGFGFTIPIQNSEGLEQIYFPLCETIYMRRYFDQESERCYGVQMSYYKNNLFLSAIPSDALTLEFVLPASTGGYTYKIKVYCSAMQAKVHTHYTNGRDEVAIRGFEFGVGLIYN